MIGPFEVVTMHFLDGLLCVVCLLELEDAAAARLVLLIPEEIHVAHRADLLLKQVLHILQGGVSGINYQNIVFSYFKKLCMS